VDSTRLFRILLVCWAALAGCGAPACSGQSRAQCKPDTTWDRFTEIPLALKPPFDPAAEIHIHSLDDESAARRRLIKEAWGGKLPESVPFSIQPARADLEGLENIDSAEAWQSLFGTLIYVLHPAAPNGRAVIVHQGHASYAGRWSSGVGTLIDHLLSRGFTVAAMQMPLQGWNKGPWTSHAALIEARGNASLAQFIGPVIEVVNRLYDSYTDVSMAGFSGGGWTTVLAAAIDTRITRSAAVAGSLPVTFRNAYKEKVCIYHASDEQSDLELYNELSYEDLYVLGASDGRRQVQINNQYDSCCFYGVSSSLYAPHVAKAASGSWTFELDSTHKNHKLSTKAMERIDALLDE